MLKQMLFAGIVLLGPGNSAWSQNPPKAPNVEPEQQSEGGLKAKENGDHQTQSAPKAMPRIPEVIPACANGERQNKSNEGGDQGTEFWPPLYGYRLKVTDTLLVSITFLLFLATRRLVRGAEQTAKRQLRAYVLPEKAFIITFGPDIVADIIFKNMGQTPAHDVKLWLSIEIATDPLHEKPAAPSSDPVSRGVIGPGVNIYSRVQIPCAITQEEKIGVESGKAGVYLIGQVSYRDAFGKPQTSDFCFIYGGKGGCAPDGAMGPYKDYNKVT